jgi:hypothetical protein
VLREVMNTHRSQSPQVRTWQTQNPDSPMHRDSRGSLPSLGQNREAGIDARESIPNGMRTANGAEENRSLGKQSPGPNRGAARRSVRADRMNLEVDGGKK